MSSTTYACTPDDVLALAKHTLKQIPCEWQNCPGPSVLNSWNSFEQHVKQHCYNACDDLDRHVCQYRSCSGRFHTSQAELVIHVLNSHCTRIQMPCPFSNCRWTFYRASQLDSHLEDEHSENYNNEKGILQIHASALKPSSRPFRPSPPPILEPLVLGKQQVREVLPLPIRLQQFRYYSRHTKHQFEPPCPNYRAWGYIDNLGPEEEAEKQMEDYEPPPPLNLKSFQAAELTDVEVTLEVRPKPPERYLDPVKQLLSRPIPISTMPITLKSPISGVPANGEPRCTAVEG
ncbi:hypothetical protein BDY19DRAFT_914414 [Irpex rosettiformis]|uniref:Uncharacterized protein n=1 Tax=Irpex rosettiformis TaxID=378272 RepID=A0ACB8UM60_9APHY|nr:hypothetical protein BDY19DRAFT_914414 [Irpex rosettiformis]